MAEHGRGASQGPPQDIGKPSLRGFTSDEFPTKAKAPKIPETTDPPASSQRNAPHETRGSKWPPFSSKHSQHGFRKVQRRDFLEGPSAKQSRSYALFLDWEKVGFRVKGLGLHHTHTAKHYTAGPGRNSRIACGPQRRHT